jgi:hypothetical protein
MAALFDKIFLFLSSENVLLNTASFYVLNKETIYHNLRQFWFLSEEQKLKYAIIITW